MGDRRYVPLDPYGTGNDWLYVVVHAPTGVFYEQQYGGTACRQGKAEGFLVPLTGPRALAGLRELFEGHFRGAGTWGHGWADAELDGLRELVGDVPYWQSDGTREQVHALRLDESRLGEADEAWLPVITPDGPGLLLWPNSD
jgi:hypothetical protein